MVRFLFALGLLQMAGGILVAFAAKSAIHEILGAISFGMGTLALGISKMIDLLDDVKRATEKQTQTR